MLLCCCVVVLLCCCVVVLLCCCVVVLFVVVVVWTNVDDVSIVSHVLPLKEKCTGHWGGTNDFRDSRH